MRQSYELQIGKAAIVTPCVGVWIETRPMRIDKPGRQSHTLRGCVDWNKLMRSPDRQCVYVTPCVGVWIETL